MEDTQQAQQETQPESVAVESTQQQEQQNAEEVVTFPIRVVTCTENQSAIILQAGLQDNIQDIRQYLNDAVDTCYITQFELYMDNEKLSDYADFGSIPDMRPNAVIEMREAYYDERSIRLHIRRLRDVMGATDTGISPSIFLKLSQAAGEEVAGLQQPGDDSSKSTTTASSSSDNNKKSKNSSSTTTTNNKEKKKESQQQPQQPLSTLEELNALVAIQFEEVPPVLSSYYPTEASEKFTATSFLKSLGISGWNPVPGYRRLQGDLLYLEVISLEGRIFHITGNSKGFYVNSSTSTVFNPLPLKDAHYGAKAHSLAQLLMAVSPLFKKNFLGMLQSTFTGRHPFEMLPVASPVYPWVVKKEKHRFDSSRAEDYISSSLDAETGYVGQIRDWNEEYQSCKELPKETIHDRILRDRALFKVNSEFTEAVAKGATKILNGSIPPLNPTDDERSHMYIYNSIFFSPTNDSRDFYKKLGGDRAAHMSINNDLKGVKMLNRADVIGLHTLATCIVDYGGKRLCAQSIIPGILQREQTATVVYGSMEQKLNNHEKFHQLLSEAGKSLAIKPHQVISDEITYDLAIPVESKGIIGTDNRHYILDLIRLTPRDTNYNGVESPLAILRPELVEMYVEHLALQKKRLALREKKKEQQDAAINNIDTESSPEISPEEKEKNEEEKRKELEDELSITAEELSVYAMNPNILINNNTNTDEEDNNNSFNYKVVGTPEELAEQEKLVKDAAAFLKNTVIPAMIEDFSWFFVAPVDGQTLTSVMHLRGINMRYLGHITKLTSRPSVKNLCIQEMITRAAKNLFREIMEKTSIFERSEAVAHFLNCLLSEAGAAPLTAEDPASAASAANQQKKKKKNKKPYTGLPKEATPAFHYLSSNSLWTRLVQLVKERFDYDQLPESRDDIMKSIICTISTLRSICQKVGIQVDAVDYNLKLSTPFKSENIVDLFPLLKSAAPETTDGKNLLDAGKAFLQQGRLDIAFELLSEALAVFHQTYGPLHRDTANCYGNLALVLFHAKDIPTAIEHQQKATIINERVMGLDHHDTQHSYGNLSLFYSQLGKTSASLAFIRHALYLGRLLVGNVHPDTATTLTNIGTMLQDLLKVDQCIQYYNEALKSYEVLLGADHVQVAAINHLIAIAYSLTDNFKEALKYEKKNYNILANNKIPENDPRFVESNVCLKTFTARAVQAQIENKKAQIEMAAQLSQQRLAQLAQRRAGSMSAAPVAPSSGPHMGARNLDEIMNFINGTKISGNFSQRNQRGVAASSSPAAAATSSNAATTTGEGKKKKKKKPTSANSNADPQ